MSYGLKNASATFQRLMDKVFKDQKGQNLEAYVDDILVKSRRKEDHLKNLEETFRNIRKVGIKLKLNKCAFRITKGKLLGYMISFEGIKPNLEKVQAFLRMKSPKCLKEV